MKLYQNHYIGLFDLALDQVFAERRQPDIHVAQPFFLPGDYASHSPTLQSNAKFLEALLSINIDQSQLKRIFSFDQPRPFEINGNTYEGKRIHNYYYPIKKHDCGHNYDHQRYDWVDIDELFEGKQDFTKAIFDDFVTSNNLI